MSDHTAKKQEEPLNASLSTAGRLLEPSHAEVETVQRFDRHQRAQHGMMIISFILLVLTGWPLSTSGIGASSSLVGLFGGLEGAAWIHRKAALLMVFLSVYHLIYIVGQVRQKKIGFDMVPTPKDATHLYENLLYFVGIRRDRPYFGRFTYFEKFDYWAIFWGVPIMVGSGLIRWFPEQTMAWLPSWAYEIAFFAHTDEALLAASAIFFWHFYNVHLRPSVFPMSKVFLTGRLTMDQLHHEHPAEYDKVMEKRREGVR